MEEYVARVVEARKREVAKALSRSSIGKSVEVVQTPLADLIIDRCEGKRLNGKLYGPCRALFKDGHQYEGEFAEGRMHGLGRFTWTDGLVYEGEMERSKLTGRGTYTWPDGSTYTGGVVDGIRHGYGVYYSPVTGTTYSGQWVNGEREGKGHLAYHNGPGQEGEEGEGGREGEGEGGEEEGESFYNGDWKNNRQHGTGLRRYRSGNEYRGEWREGEKEGEGEMVWGGGRQRYRGHWSNGSLNGHGVYVWQSTTAQNHAQHPVSNRYEGEWKDGLRHGNGTFYYASGAVYKGEWVEGQKQGRGTFTSKNGELFTGVFHRDRLSSQHGGEEEEEGERKVFPRPKTPLGTLIGDVLGDQGDSGRFSVSLSPLLSSLADPGSQLHQVHSVILQYMSQLSRVYHFYSSLGCQSHSPSHTLTRLQFWQLLKDCRVHYEGLSLWEADAVAAEQPPCPTACLLMREFLQLLVTLSHHLYSSTISGDVSVCLSHFLTKLLLPNACSLTGTLFTTVSSPSLQQVGMFWDLYQSLAQYTSEGAMFVTMRTLLWRFEDSGMIPSLLPAESVVRALVHDQPLAVDTQDYNLDIKMTVLDVMETVSRCCGQVMSCEQSHDQVSESCKPISQVLSQLFGILNDTNGYKYTEDGGL